MPSITSTHKDVDCVQAKDLTHNSNVDASTAENLHQESLPPMLSANDLHEWGGSDSYCPPPSTPHLISVSSTSCHGLLDDIAEYMSTHEGGSLSSIWMFEDADGRMRFLMASYMDAENSVSSITTIPGGLVDFEDIESAVWSALPFAYQDYHSVEDAVASLGEGYCETIILYNGLLPEAEEHAHAGVAELADLKHVYIPFEDVSLSMPDTVRTFAGLEYADSGEGRRVESEVFAEMMGHMGF